MNCPTFLCDPLQFARLLMVFNNHKERLYSNIIIYRLIKESIKVTWLFGHALFEPIEYSVLMPQINRCLKLWQDQCHSDPRIVFFSYLYQSCVSMTFLRLMWTSSPPLPKVVLRSTRIMNLVFSLNVIQVFSNEWATSCTISHVGVDFNGYVLK